MEEKLLKMTKKKRVKPRRMKLTLMALPFVIFVFLFCYVPLMGWALAFFDYRPGLALNRLKFVGFKYFELLGYYGDDIVNALVNTLGLSGLSMLTSLISPLFAILLTEVRHNRLKKGIQTMITLPHFVSWIIVSALCFSLFSTNGMVNQLLQALGYTGRPVNVLGNGDTAWAFMTALDIWKEVGWNSIVYLAAIAGIDEELHDAARVDGASRFQRICHITVPGLTPTFIVLLLLKVGNLLSVGFEKYIVFNNSLMASRLEVIDVYTYRIGIGTQDYSFAIAVSILKSVVSILLLFSVNSLAKRIRGDSII